MKKFEIQADFSDLTREAGAAEIKMESLKDIATSSLKAFSAYEQGMLNILSAMRHSDAFVTAISNMQKFERRIEIIAEQFGISAGAARQFANEVDKTAAAATKREKSERALKKAMDEVNAAQLISNRLQDASKQELLDLEKATNRLIALKAKKYDGEYRDLLQLKQLLVDIKQAEEDRLKVFKALGSEYDKNINKQIDAQRRAHDEELKRNAQSANILRRQNEQQVKDEEALEKRKQRLRDKRQADLERERKANAASAAQMRKDNERAFKEEDAAIKKAEVDLKERKEKLRKEQIYSFAGAGYTNSNYSEAQMVRLRAALAQVAAAASAAGISVERLKMFMDGTIRSAEGLSAAEQKVFVAAAAYNAKVSAINANTEAMRRLKKGIQEVTVSWESFERLVFARALTTGFYLITESIRASVKEAANLQVKVAEVQTIIGKAEQTGEAFKSITAEAFRMSSQYNVDVFDTVEAFYDTVSNQLGETLQQITTFNAASIMLAKTTQSTVEDSSNAIASVLNAYGLGVEHAEDVSAKLFKTVDLGRLRLNEIANSLGRVLVPAAQLGVTFEEVFAGLSEITISGVPVSEAMTGLYNMMYKMQRPTKEMRAVFQEWGVASGQAAFATYGFEGILAKLNDESLEGLEHFGDMFGNIRALRGAMGLTGESFATYLKTLSEIKDAHADFTRATEKILTNHGEKFNNMVNKIRNDFIIGFGNPVIDMLMDMDLALKIFNSSMGDAVVLGSKFLGILAATQLTSIAGAGIGSGLAKIGIATSITSKLGIYGAALGFAASAIAVIYSEINSSTKRQLEEFQLMLNDKYGKILQENAKFQAAFLDNKLESINTKYQKLLQGPAEQATQLAEQLKETNVIIDEMEAQSELRSKAFSAFFKGSWAEKAEVIVLYKDAQEVSNELLQAEINLIENRNDLTRDQKNALHAITLEGPMQESTLKKEIALREKALTKLQSQLDKTKELIKQSEEYNASQAKDRSIAAFERYNQFLSPGQQASNRFGLAGSIAKKAMSSTDIKVFRDMMQEAYQQLSQSESQAASIGLFGNPRRHMQVFESAFAQLDAMNAQFESNYMNYLQNQQAGISKQGGSIEAELSTLKSVLDYQVGSVDAARILYESYKDIQAKIKEIALDEDRNNVQKNQAVQDQIKLYAKLFGSEDERTKQMQKQLDLQLQMAGITKFQNDAIRAKAGEQALNKSFSDLSGAKVGNENAMKASLDLIKQQLLAQQEQARGEVNGPYVEELKRRMALPKGEIGAFNDYEYNLYNKYIAITALTDQLEAIGNDSDLMFQFFNNLNQAGLATPAMVDAMVSYSTNASSLNKNTIALSDTQFDLAESTKRSKELQDQYNIILANQIGWLNVPHPFFGTPSYSTSPVGTNTVLRSGGGLIPRMRSPLYRSSGGVTPKYFAGGGRPMSVGSGYSPYERYVGRNMFNQQYSPYQGYVGRTMFQPSWQPYTGYDQAQYGYYQMMLQYQQQQMMQRMYGGMNPYQRYWGNMQQYGRGNSYQNYGNYYNGPSMNVPYINRSFVNVPKIGFANGGQPRGTDTIPAMLSPGEFIIKASAVRGNLRTLHAINYGGIKLDSLRPVNVNRSRSTQYYAEGGEVNNNNTFHVSAVGNAKIDARRIAIELNRETSIGTARLGKKKRVF